MKVYELIEQLKLMPQDAIVTHLWDGYPYTEINFVWLSKGTASSWLIDGRAFNQKIVVTADYHEVCYDDDMRPIDAPSEDEEPHWYTPEERRDTK